MENNNQQQHKIDILDKIGLLDKVMSSCLEEWSYFPGEECHLCPFFGIWMPRTKPKHNIKYMTHLLN